MPSPICFKSSTFVLRLDPTTHESLDDCSQRLAPAPFGLLVSASVTDVACLLGHRLCMSAAILDGAAASIVALMAIAFVALRTPARFRTGLLLREKDTQLAMAV